MEDLLNNPGFIALVGTLFGGAGLKMIESWLGRAKQRQEANQVMRDELRKEIESLRMQLTSANIEEQRLEAEIEAWRSKYYDLRDEQQKVVTELMIVSNKLKALEGKA